MINNQWKRAECESAHCVEVKMVEDMVYIQDSEDATGKTLAISSTSWHNFVRGAKFGHFDLPYSAR